MAMAEEASTVSYLTLKIYACLATTVYINGEPARLPSVLRLRSSSATARERMAVKVPEVRQVKQISDNK